MHNEVMYFINQFKKLDKESIEDVFLNGNCYWFAQILLNRFPNDAELYYMGIEGHFIVKIESRFYDISGARDELPEIPVLWSQLQYAEPTYASRIYRNCALFID